MRHIGKIKLRINAVGVHIHCKSDYIHISRSFAVSEKGTLNTVGSRKQGKLRIGNACSSVVMRMK